MARHTPTLEQLKRKAFREDPFGNITGEITFPAIDLRTEATKFLLAVKWTTPVLRDRCDDLLQILGKYNILYDFAPSSQGKAMSSRIFADIERRGITEQWDRIPVVANSCDYAIRFDAKTMAKNQRSLGLFSLAMFLLNGEIIDNSKTIKQDPTRTPFWEYLDGISFSKFDPPLSSGHLTWLKNCRFSDVNFSEMGMGTRGYLWRIYERVNTSVLPSYRSRGNTSLVGLTSYQRGRLKQLEDRLRRTKQKVLADHLLSYLSEDEDVKRAYQSCPKQNAVKNHKDTMAEAIVEAIRTKRTLLLATMECFDDERATPSHAQAIFVKPEKGYMRSAFSNWYCGVDKDGRERERHVYLQVEVGGHSWPPRLCIKDWTSGLAFFKGCSPHEVSIQWPKAWTRPLGSLRPHSLKRPGEAIEEVDAARPSKRSA